MCNKKRLRSEEASDLRRFFTFSGCLNLVRKDVRMIPERDVDLSYEILDDVRHGLVGPRDGARIAERRIAAKPKLGHVLSEELALGVDDGVLHGIEEDFSILKRLRMERRLEAVRVKVVDHKLPDAVKARPAEPLFEVTDLPFLGGEVTHELPSSVWIL